jgi:hypothetical protein
MSGIAETTEPPDEAVPEEPPQPAASATIASKGAATAASLVERFIATSIGWQGAGPFEDSSGPKT